MSDESVEANVVNQNSGDEDTVSISTLEREITLKDRQDVMFILFNKWFI